MGSFKHQLFRNISIFLLIPVALVVGYSLVMSYLSESRLSIDAIKAQNSSLVASVNGRLTKVQYSILALGNKKGFGELAYNILYSQYVDKSLRNFVQQNSLIDGAFIMDREGFVLEGYPLSTLAIRSQPLTQQVELRLSAAAELMLPDFTLIPSNYLLGMFENLQQPPVDRIAFVYTLQRSTKSLVSPMQNSAALYVLLNHDNLIDYNESDGSVVVQHALTVNGLPVVSDYQIDANKSAFHADLELPLWLEQHPTQIKLSTYFSPSGYLNAIYYNIGLTFLALVVVFTIALQLLKKWLDKMHEPLNDIVVASNNIAQGKYYQLTGRPQFIEFQQIYHAMNKMMSHIHQQISELKKARTKAESSDKLKSQFLANMSHEIRTPMNGVLGVLQVMQTQPLDKKMSNLLKTATQSSHNLLAILNDILDFSKIEADQLALESVPFDLVELVDSSVSVIRTQLEQKDISFGVSIDDACKGAWRGDPVRITQVLQNLLSNAYKFTEHGSIHLDVSFIENGSQLHFKVTDTGIGISDEQKLQLFSPFKQGDTSTSRKYGGTGLGLAISHKLARLMGGDLWVESDGKFGSVFEFYVTVEPIKFEASEDIKYRQPPQLPDCSILIAEDSHINQEVLRFMLEPSNAKLIFANNGKEAIELSLNHKPDLIFMDVQMPEVDGLEATKLLRSKGFVTPIIMQTANVCSDDVKQYWAAGADGVISKPTNIQDVNKCLWTHLVGKTH